MHRPVSELHVICICGKPIVSITRETKCPHCGRLTRIDWPVPPPHIHTL